MKAAITEEKNVNYVIWQGLTYPSSVHCSLKIAVHYCKCHLCSVLTSWKNGDIFLKQSIKLTSKLNEFHIIPLKTHCYPHFCASFCGSLLPWFVFNDELLGPYHQAAWIFSCLGKKRTKNFTFNWSSQGHLQRIRFYEIAYGQLICPHLRPVCLSWLICLPTGRVRAQVQGKRSLATLCCSDERVNMKQPFLMTARVLMPSDIAGT